MEVFAQTGNSLEMLNTEKGFRTTLFGFARNEVLAFIDQMMNDSATRNSQLNSSLVDMEVKLSEVREENDALLEKTRVLVDRLEEKRDEQIKHSKEVEELEKELALQKEIVEQLNNKLYSQEQENNLSLSEIAALKKQIAALEERIAVANETSKQADDTIVAAQRAATRIMTEAVKQSPRPEPAINSNELFSLKDTIHSLEKQLKAVSDTVETAWNTNQKGTGEYAGGGYYNTPKTYEPEPEVGLNGGWISANIPQPPANHNVSYWQPVERPTTPVGWQQVEQFNDYRQSNHENATGTLPNENMTASVNDPQPNSVYHHRRSEPVIERTVRLLKPSGVNYSQLRRQRKGKYVVTPHKR